MALSKPWEVSSKPQPVPVYVDGERLGAAESASVRLAGFHGPIELVELTGLRDLSTPAGQLQHNYDVMVRDRKIEELEVRIGELEDRGVADGDDIQYWHRRWEAADRENGKLRGQLDLAEENHKSNLEQVRKKYKTKLRNLQMNFEQQSNGKTRSSKLKKQLESSQSYNEHLKQCVQEKDDELTGLKSKYYRQSLELDVRVKEIKDLESKLDRERGSDSYWHEKYLESEKAVADLSESRKRLYDRSVKLSTDLARSRSENKKLIDDYNRLSDDINCFMEDFSEGATAINRAVEDWNATVSE